MFTILGIFGFIKCKATRQSKKNGKQVSPKANSQQPLAYFTKNGHFKARQYYSLNK